MKRLLISAFALSTLLTAYNCKEEKKQPTVNLTKEINFTKEGTAIVKKAVTDSVVANLNIEIADNDYEHQTGLMYRKSMGNDQAMLFVFTEAAMKSFYMKNTEISLDIIYLNKDLEIINIQKNAKPMDPTSLPSAAPAMYVLEVNGGLTDTWGLASGDVLEWTRL